MQINIIGAGPIGSYTAYLLSKKGHQVNLFEEHHEIGQPVQCTGIVTPEFSKIIKLKKDFLLNTTKYFKIISPSNNSALIKKKEYILDRTALDQYLVDLAQNNGSQLHLNHRFIQQDQDYLFFKHKNKTIRMKKDITVGADGPFSKTAQAFNFPNQNHFYYGFQARIKGNFDPSLNKVTFGQKIAPGFFSWLVPENQHTARIGLATNQKTSYYFQQLIKNHKSSLIDYQAGLMPIYNPKIKTQHQNTYLIGDAATQVKATTGGGLVPALQAAQCLSQAIDQKQNYSNLWKKNLDSNLKKHLFIRKILNRFSDSDYDLLIKILNQPKNKEFVQDYNRENPSLIKLAQFPIQNPKMICLLRHLFHA